MSDLKVYNAPKKVQTTENIILERIDKAPGKESFQDIIIKDLDEPLSGIKVVSGATQVVKPEEPVSISTRVVKSPQTTTPI